MKRYTNLTVSFTDFSGNRQTRQMLRRNKDIRAVNILLLQEQ